MSGSGSGTRIQTYVSAVSAIVSNTTDVPSVSGIGTGNALTSLQCLALVQMTP